MTTTAQLPISSANPQHNIIVLPQITVQHDISNVIEDVRDAVVSNGWEDIWASCYLEGRPTIHGKVRIARSDGQAHGISFEARDGIQWQGSSTAEFRVACPSLNIQPTSIRLPKHIYRPPDSYKNQKVTAFDVAPDNSRFATGYGDGSIIISSTSLSGPSSQKIGKPHFSTILSLRFFPSSVVLLSSSSDYSLKIHDANTASTTTNAQGPGTISTVRSLQAHSAGVTGSAIVERGKNVLSFGKDATARLWNVGLGKEIVGRRWRAEKGSPVLCGSAGEIPEKLKATNHGAEGENSGERVALEGEVGTENKLVFVGLQDGSVRGYELASGLPRFFSSPIPLPPTLDQPNAPTKTSPIDSICYSPERMTLAAGRRDGYILIWDLNSVVLTTTSSTEEIADTAPTFIIRRNTAGIETLDIPTNTPTMSEHQVHVLVGSIDGLFCRLGIRAGLPPKVLEEFVGVEAGKSIRAVKAIRTEEDLEIIWCAADDGVRRY